MRLRLAAAFVLCVSLASAFASQPAKPAYQPLGKTAYLTSSFGENRGTRYHIGVDFSTNMEEGWPVIAPSDGTAEFAARGAFGYGRYIKFKAKDGSIWLFAHLSEFSHKIDSLMRKEMLKKEKPNAQLSIKIPFKKGDTLAYSGSTGIGNPHLHIERRDEGDKTSNSPCKAMECPDSVKPFFLGLDTAFGGIAVKIADYSREPFENPMSVKSLKIMRGKKMVYSKTYDEIPVESKQAPKIREDLLWSERTDEFGDWHFAPVSMKDLGALAEFKFIAEDFSGNSSEAVFEQPLARHKIKHQAPSLYTFLSKAEPPGAVDSLLRIGNAKKLSKENEDFESGGVSQMFRGLSKRFLPNAAAWRSAGGNVFEFHPKGLQLETWEVCLDTALAPHPLYWRGETTRKWFYFSKQTLSAGKRCAKANELRDVASFLDTVPPSIGNVYAKRDFAGKEICRIPVLDSLSGLDLASVDFRDKNGNWVIFDYDSDPAELFVERRDFNASEPLGVRLCDEAGNCARKEIRCAW